MVMRRLLAWLGLAAGALAFWRWRHRRNAAPPAAAVDPAEELKQKLLDEKVKKLELSDQDKKDLVAFMEEGLTGALPKVERTRLPADPAAAAENAAESEATN